MRRHWTAGCAALIAAAGLASSALAAMDVHPDPDAPRGRLPAGGPRPTAYRLDLKVLPEEPRFSGRVEIDVALSHPQSRIYMHGRGLSVSHAAARVNGVEVPATWTVVDPTGVVRLDFPRPLPAGAATLVFAYDAPFGDSPSGMYHIKVADRWYSWTQFESTDARAAYPSFDEPGFKTPFTVSITTRPGFQTVSNAPEVGVRPAPGGLETHAFAPTRPLPTYLVAMDVGPFAHPRSTVAPDAERRRPLPLGAVATQAEAANTGYVLAETPRIVELLEAYFGQPFPFPKLDQIGSPEMPGAMENAGADTYADDLIFLDGHATTSARQAFGMVVSHELSHQWFGDLVSPDWWDDIWLNESFANWMGYRIGNAWRPELKINLGAIGEAFNAMSVDALEAGRPIHQHIATNAEIDSAFDSITYGKGGQVIAMIAAYLGDERFRDGVRLHLSRHMYGNATTDQFFQALADAAKDPRVLTAMRSFVDQPGVPLVTFTRTPTGLTATQSRYALLGGHPAPERWVIPLCLDEDGRRLCRLLDAASAPVPAPASGVLVPNAGGTGYYRFDMPPEDWARTLAALPRLPAGEALAVDDSLWASFRAGRAAPELLLSEARSINAHPATSASLSAADRLQGLRVRGLIEDASLPDYRRLMRDLYAPRLAALGFDPRAGAYAAEDPDRQKLRTELVALVAEEARDAALEARLAETARAYLGGDAKALDPAFMSSAFSAYVAAEGLPGARRLADAALSSEDPVFRNAAMLSLTGSGRRDVADWALGFSDPRLRPNERLYLVIGLVRTPETREFALDWIVAHYDELAKGNGVFFASRVPALVAVACSAARADELERDLGPKVLARGAGALEFRRAVEQARRCGDLKAARSDALARALKAAS